VGNPATGGGSGGAAGSGQATPGALGSGSGGAKAPVTATGGTPGSMTPTPGTMTPSTMTPGTPMASSDAGAPKPSDAGPPPPPSGSSGCGASGTPPAGGMKMIDVGGTQRQYIVTLPTNYDPKKFYKLVFAWHGLGGTAMQTAGGVGFGYYGLQSMAADSAIFVAGQGLDTGNGGAGWPNTNGQDIAFVKAMLDSLRASYCIDDKRIFSVGMSYGGIMSNQIGCELGDVFRAIAPMSGSGPRVGFGGASKCVGQVAVWMAHGNMDTTVPFASGQASRDHWVMNNHCSMNTMPVDPSRCVSYQGCDAGYPVTWCEFDGAHTIWQPSSKAIWAFFSQF
jgi:polyhydroxybutyrate depolymerase